MAEAKNLPKSAIPVRKIQETADLGKKSKVTSVGDVKKTAQKRIDKSQRNNDGTFKAGNVGGGRPPENLSVRAQTKLRVARDPELLQNALDNMFEILTDPEHPFFAKMLDTFVKLNGNYDPAETKDVTRRPVDRPLEGFNISQLEKLLGRKR
jgi:hypothetical protein